MKKYISFVLCWLLIFESFGSTSFKAKSALSVASGYVTSLNRLDGSFETGTSNFTASTGTLTLELSSAMEGNYRGSWASSASGTLDTVAQAISATNTYLASYLVESSDPSNTQICSVVNTVENGCKTINNSTTQQKAEWIGTLKTNDSVKVRVKYLGSSTTIKVDNFKLEPWVLNTANLTSQQSTEQLTTSSCSYSGNFAAFPSLTSVGNDIYTVSTVSSHNRFTFLKNSKVSGSVTFSLTTGAPAVVFKNGANIFQGSLSSSSGYNGHTAFSLNMNVGDYLEFGPNTNQSGTTCALSIIAQSVSENIVQSWQDGTNWKTLTYAEVNALAGNQGLGTFTAGGVEWMRGNDGLLHYKGKLTVGTTTASEARIPFPSGLISADTNKIPSIQSAGMLNNSAQQATSYNVLVSPSLGYFNIGYWVTGAASSLTASLGNIFTNGNQLSFNFTVPIAGWSSLPTLLALPVSNENYFSARINNPSGTASIVSQNSDWIASATRSSAGSVTIVSKNLGLTAIPSIFYQSIVLVNNGTRNEINNISVSNGAVTFTTNNYTPLVGNYDESFFISIQKQSPDYVTPGVFVGNVQPEWQYDLTVTGTNWTTTRAVGVVYKMGSGQYRMRFNIVGTVSPSVTSIGLSAIGVTFKNISSYSQAISVSPSGGSGSTMSGECIPNSNNISLAGASSGGWRLSGDVELESKPTFAVNTP
jgi:hypothetical protein